MYYKNERNYKERSQLHDGNRRSSQVTERALSSDVGEILFPDVQGNPTLFLRVLGSPKGFWNRTCLRAKARVLHIQVLLANSLQRRKKDGKPSLPNVDHKSRNLPGPLPISSLGNLGESTGLASMGNG